MKRHISTLAITAIISTVALTSAQGEVVHRQINAKNLLVHVSDDSWQPEGFVNGTAIPATYVHTANISLDGKADEDAWNQAVEVEVPLAYGPVKTASLKVLYDDEDVFIRVRWPDDTEDRQHHPWVWDSEQEKFVAGSQVEDSVMLSFEAGCEWQPSFLAGYIFDFDGWHWMAARTDPLGQAVDLYGNIQDQDMNPGHMTRYESRVKQDTWNMKFTENADPDLYAEWNDLDRVYMMQPVTGEVYYQGVPDGRDSQAFVEQVPAPAGTPYPRDAAKPVPQFSPVKLTDGAGEVRAKGNWEDGFWTVEFRRARITPANTLNDTVFNRLVQFSVHVFDQGEKVDEASESDRLFLQFLPAGQSLVSN